MAINGQELVKNACRELGINLTALVAATSVWASPDSVAHIRRMNINPNALWKTNIRRLRLKDGEVTGEHSQLDDHYLDDNSVPNYAMKVITGKVVDQNSFHVCHIYPGSCYEVDFHTAIPNLVFIPKEIAGLSDFDENVMQALKYRSYELYDFYIDEIPQKPLGYDSLRWREPEPYTSNAIKAVSRRDYYHRLRRL